MDDFDLEARRQKLYNNIKNKWKSISKEYKKKLKKKEMSIMRQLQLKNEKILEDKKKAMEIGKKKSDNVLKNLEEYNKQQEEKRLKLEQDTFLKSNYINN